MLKTKINRTVAVILTLVMMLSILFVAPVSSKASAYVSIVKSKRYAYWTTDGKWIDITLSQPRINFNTYDARVANAEIEENVRYDFMELDREMKEKRSPVKRFEYHDYTSNGILTVILYISAGDWPAGYYVYNFRISTGKRVYNNELCKAFGIDLNSRMKLAQALDETERKKWGTDKNEWNHNSHRDFEFYVGANNRLNVVYGNYWNQRLGTVYANPSIPHVNATNNGAEVKWNKISGVPKYRVYKKINGSWKKLGDTTSNKYTDKSAKAGGTYTYTVRGINSNASTFMTSYKASGASVKFLATPKVNRRDYTSNGAKVSWSKVTGASKYRLYQWNNNKWNKIGDTSNNYLNLTNFASGANYRYTVRAISSSANQFTSGYNTNGYSFKYIGIPQIYDAYNTSSNGIMVKWSKPTGAEKFRVYRKSGNGSWQKIADTNSTQYHDRSVKSGVYYKYTVRCMTKDAKQFVSYYNTYGYGIRH